VIVAGAWDCVSLSAGAKTTTTVVFAPPDGSVCRIGREEHYQLTDCGAYAFWAGPVRITAPHECINIWAAVKKADGSVVTKKFWHVHCG
jgi:hypothetical protein